MDDIQKRLTETAKKTLDSYEAWSKGKSNGDAREALNEAVHELRKVASRVEIEMAVSEREEQSRNRIPIPPHRSKKPAGAQKNLNEIVDEDDGDNFGNGDMPKPKRQGKPGGGSRPRRKQANGDQ